MANKVIGVRQVSFKDKETKKPIEGVTVYFSYPINKDGEGEAADKVFLSNYLIEKHGGAIPSVGDEIDLLYNKYGKVGGYEVIAK